MEPSAAPTVPHWHFPPLTTQATCSSTFYIGNKRWQTSAYPHSHQTRTLAPFRDWFFFFCHRRRSRAREEHWQIGGSVHYGVLQVEQSTKSPISTTQNKNKYVLHGVLIGTFSSLLYLTIIRIWALKNKREIIWTWFVVCLAWSALPLEWMRHDFVCSRQLIYHSCWDSYVQINYPNHTNV